MRARLSPDPRFQLLEDRPGSGRSLSYRVRAGRPGPGLALSPPVPPWNWPGGAGSPGPTLTFALRFRPVRAGGRFISRFLSPVRLQTPIFKAIEKVYAIKAVATFLRPSPLPPSGSPWEGSESALAAAPASHGPEPRRTHRPRPV